MGNNKTIDQINEIQNVLTTLVETTDHLTTLAKSEELEQSVYIFASLIEGTEAVFKVMLTLHVDVAAQMKNIEQTLLDVAQALENEALEKASEQAENNLRPEFVRMMEKFANAS